MKRLKPINPANHKICRALKLFASFSCDLDWIQTSNLLSRNQVRYSVAPRGLLIFPLTGCKYISFYIYHKIKSTILNGFKKLN